MSNFTGRNSFEALVTAYRQAIENQFGLEFNTNPASNNRRFSYPILEELLKLYNKHDDCFLKKLTFPKRLSKYIPSALYIFR